MLNYYKIATTLASPLVPLWLRLRSMKGKEDAGRMAERFGRSSYARPKGKLLWVHAASIGEANSVLAMIHKLRARFPELGILLTTGTVTSAALMKQRLPQGVLHHYAPVDTPEATERFMRHWLPDVVWFVESELWPNLIDAAKRYYCLLALINARMSPHSFASWKKYGNFAKEMLSSFRLCFAQSEADAERLRILGAPEVMTVGNIKYDAPPLGFNEGELVALQKMCAGRTVWLAASIHPGEEQHIAKAHALLAKAIPNILTVVVPRHPSKGEMLAANLATAGKVALRSKKQPIAADTAFYMADTLGELGTFYRLSEVVFIGGTLVAHGGQNPLEAAQLSCAIIFGPHTENFQSMCEDMQKSLAAVRIADATQLAAQLHVLLSKSDMRDDLQSRAKTFTQERAGASNAIIDIFAPVFAP